MRNLILIFTFFVFHYTIKAQTSLHSGLKQMPNLEREGYLKKVDIIKLSTKTNKQTECQGTVYKYALVCACGNTVKEFYPLYDGKVYKTESGKIVETGENENYFVIFDNKSTHYYIKK